MSHMNLVAQMPKRSPMHTNEIWAASGPDILGAGDAGLTNFSICSLGMYIPLPSFAYGPTRREGPRGHGESETLAEYQMSGLGSKPDMSWQRRLKLL